MTCPLFLDAPAAVFIAIIPPGNLNVVWELGA